MAEHQPWGRCPIRADIKFGGFSQEEAVSEKIGARVAKDAARAASEDSVASQFQFQSHVHRRSH
jgi:hypothetical protein